MQTNERDVILKNKENLEMALDIISMSQEIRERRNQTLQTNERGVIMEHVLENDENWEVAQNIISMSQEIRGCIIKTFLEKLKDFICEGFRCKNLDMSQWDWETELLDNPFGRSGYHFFGVKNKNKPVSIELSANSKGNDLSIGVFAPINNNLSDDLVNDLKNQLKDEFRSEKSWKSKYKIWLWYQNLAEASNGNYKDWTDKDTLMKMYTETDCVVEDIGTLLLRIIEVAKPEIEEWAHNPPAQ